MLALIDILELAEPFRVRFAQAAHNAPHDLAVEVIALQLFRKTVSPIDVIARARRGAAQRPIRHADGTHAALHIRDPDRSAPRSTEPGIEFSGNSEVAVLHGELIVGGQTAGAA